MYTYDVERMKIVSEEALSELQRATSLHEPMHGAHEGYAVMLEEFDELWDLVKLNPKKMSIEELKAHREHIREEALQVAAMAMRFVIDVCDSP